jgi:hypothetical protein
MTRVHLLPKHWHFHCWRPAPLVPVTFSSTPKWESLEAMVEALSKDISFEGTWIQDSTDLHDRKAYDTFVFNRPSHWPGIPDGHVFVAATGKIRPVQLLDNLDDFGPFDQVGADLFSQLVEKHIPGIRLGQVHEGHVQWVSKPTALAA